MQSIDPQKRQQCANRVLPREMWIKIWSFLPCNGTMWKTIPLVCKEWYQMSNQLCHSGECTAERSVLRALINGDTSLLRHIWDDETIDLEMLVKGRWLTEILLNVKDMSLIERVLHDPRLPDTYDINVLMRRACRTGHTSLVSLLLHKHYTTADVHDFTEACRCLEDLFNDGPFSLLLCEQNIADLIADPILVRCLVSHHHHLVIRWLIRWEPAFCTSHALHSLFTYAMSAQAQQEGRARGCQWVALDSIRHAQFPWPTIKAGYAHDVARLGWSRILQCIVQHVDDMLDAPETLDQKRHFMAMMLDIAAIHGHAQCIHIVNKTQHVDQSVFYHRTFRRACCHAPVEKVYDVCQALLRSGQIDLCKLERLPRSDLWITMATYGHWQLLYDILTQTTLDIAPFVGNHGLAQCIMAKCPPRATRVSCKDRQCVVDILILLVKRNDFEASHDAMLRIALYAKELDNDRLSTALIYAKGPGLMLHDLICPGTPPQRRPHHARKRRHWHSNVDESIMVITSMSDSDEEHEMKRLKRADTDWVVTPPNRLDDDNNNNNSDSNKIHW